MEMLRRSMLFVPGNNPNMIQNAMVYGADSIILDLEDSVSAGEKDSARIFVRNAIEKLNFLGAEVVVRINTLAGAEGRMDLGEIVIAGLDAIVLPKASVKEVKLLSNSLAEAEMEKGLAAGSIKILPLVETAQGIIDLVEIVRSSQRIAGVMLGGEDLTAELGVRRTTQGEEILYARSLLALSCRAAGVDAIDTPFTDIRDYDGLLKDTRKAKGLGLTGKAAIHPNQIESIHNALAPEEEEISYSKRVLAAMEEAEKEGLGVVALDNKMIDAPVVARAQKVIKMAELSGLLLQGVWG